MGKKDELNMLFLRQLALLKLLKISNTLIQELKEKQNTVIDIALELKPAGIPFLPVIPKHFLNMRSLMKSFTHGEEENPGAVFKVYHNKKIKNLAKQPASPYFIFNVANGKKLLGRPHEMIDEFFKEKNRSGLLIEEVVFKKIFYPSNPETPVNAMGSRLAGGKKMPILRINLNGQPMLSYDFLDNAHLGTSPSCQARL